MEEEIHDKKEREITRNTLIIQRKERQCVGSRSNHEPAFFVENRLLIAVIILGVYFYLFNFFIRFLIQCFLFFRCKIMTEFFQFISCFLFHVWSFLCFLRFFFSLFPPFFLFYLSLSVAIFSC